MILVYLILVIGAAAELLAGHTAYAIVLALLALAIAGASLYTHGGRK